MKSKIINIKLDIFIPTMIQRHAASINNLKPGFRVKITPAVSHEKIPKLSGML